MRELIVAEHKKKPAEGTALIRITGLIEGHFTAEQLRLISRELKTMANDSDSGVTGIQIHAIGEVPTV